MKSKSGLLMQSGRQLAINRLSKKLISSRISIYHSAVTCMKWSLFVKRLLNFALRCYCCLGYHILDKTWQPNLKYGWPLFQLLHLIVKSYFKTLTKYNRDCILICKLTANRLHLVAKLWTTNFRLIKPRYFLYFSKSRCSLLHWWNNSLETLVFSKCVSKKEL